MPKQRQYEFRERPDKELRVNSAIALAGFVLQDSPLVLVVHRRELLDKIVWKITEAESMHKLRTRFCSLSAYSLPDEKLQHEHVFEMEKLISELLKNGQTQVERVLSVAVACVVTESEHARLNALPARLHGWDRYIEAKIPVVDMKQTQIQMKLVLLLDPRS